MKRLFLCISILIFAFNAYTEQTIKIGSPAPMTGSGAAFGEKFKKAYTMAIEEINATGGVNGYKLELLIEDTQAKPDLAVKASNNLINNGVVALVGGWASGVANAVAPVAETKKIPYILDHPALDEITRKGYKYVFRLQPTTGMYVYAMNDFLLNVVYPKYKKKLKVAYMYVDNAFGQGVYTYGIKPFFEKNANKFDLISVQSYKGEDIDYKPLLLKVKAQAPDILILTSYLTDAILLAKQINEIGLNPDIIIGTGSGHSMQDFYEKSGGIANYYFSSAPWHGDMTNPKWKEWREKWVKKYGYIPGEHEVEGYSAIYLIAEALKSVKNLEDINKTKDELKGILKNKEFKTVFGKIKFEDFDGYTNQNKAYGMTALAQWLDGKLYQVWPKSAAEKPFVLKK